MQREISELKAIAQVYRRRKHPRLAIELLKTALSMQVGMLGAEHPDVAFTNYQIAETYTEANRRDLAHQYYVDAVGIWEKRHPSETDQMLCFSAAMERLQDESAQPFERRDDRSSAA